MEKTITIDEKVQKVLAVTQGAGEQLYKDLEVIRTIDANTKEVHGKTTGGFNFKKLLNSIVIF